MLITIKVLPESWADELNAQYRQRPAAAQALRRVVYTLARRQAELDTKLGAQAFKDAETIASRIENDSRGGTITVRDYTVIATVTAPS